jgi:two-component system response regulator YesN
MRIMVVEDEEILRLGLIKMIARMDLNCSVVASASNGEEALELISQMGIDLIITDIRMPRMDGLQLIEEASALFPGIHTFILSGYDDFEYAKLAMKLKCNDYLLKPPNFAELYDLLKRICIEHELEQNKMMDDIKRREILNQNKYVLRNEFLRDLLNFPYINQVEESLTIAKSLGIKLNADRYHVLVMHFDRMLELRGKYNKHDWSLIKYAAHNIVEEISDDSPCFYDDKEDLVLFYRASNDIKKAIEICGQLKLVLRKYLNMFVSIGISEERDLKYITDGYVEANQAVRYRLISEQGMIMTYSEVTGFTKASVKGYTKQLLSLFEQDEALSIINRLEAWNRDIVNASLDFESMEMIEKEYKMGLLTLVRHFSKELEDNKVSFNKDLLDEQIEWGDSFYDKMLPVIRVLNELGNHKKRGGVENHTIKKAITYMQENYHANLTLSSISNQIYMNPAYFSVMFKKKVGKSIIEYLTEIRMEEAIKLLLHSDLKTYQIAERVGYNDAAYFSNQYKKYTGATPQEYRNSKAP